MSSIKQVRGQLRQITQEILPAVLTEELAKAVHDALKSHIDKRLDGIEKHIRASLDAIDTRSKEVQSYLVRASTPPAPSKEE